MNRTGTRSVIDRDQEAAAATVERERLRGERAGAPVREASSEAAAVTTGDGTPGPHVGPGAEPAIRVPSVFRCAVEITRIKRRLGRRGLDATLRWVRDRVEGIMCTDDVPIDAVRAVEHRVAMVGALYPARALCLEQSLALYCLLRRQGVAARYRTGVQPFPFVAHAWVEYRGEVINDVAEHVKWFAPLPDPLP